MAENTKQQESVAASQNSQSAAVLQQQTQQNARPCPKDCRKCSWMQQVCCSSMMSFQMFGMMNTMMERIEAQSKVIADLSGRIAALEINGTDLTSPMPMQGDLFTDKG